MVYDSLSCLREKLRRFRLFPAFFGLFPLFFQKFSGTLTGDGKTAIRTIYISSLLSFSSLHTGIYRLSLLHTILILTHYSLPCRGEMERQVEVGQVVVGVGLDGHVEVVEGRL